MRKQFTEKAKHVLELAKRTAQELQHSYVGTEHLLLGLLLEKECVASQVFAAHQIMEDQIMDLIDQLIAPSGVTGTMEKEGYTPRAEKLLAESEREAERFHKEMIGTEHILIAMIKEPECVAMRLMVTLGVNIQKLYVDILQAIGEDAGLYKEDFQNGKLIRKNKKSETPVLDQYSRDLTEMARNGRLDPVVGRKEEIQRVIQILSRRTKNNPCLIGEPGVGKTAIVEGIAAMIAEGAVPDVMKQKKVVTLDLSAMVAGSKYRGEFEERIKKVIAEVIGNGNILLFLDEIHTIIGAGGAEGAIDASNILKPSLARGEIQLIGATTITEYRKYIEKDAALERRFQPVMVEEPTEEEAVEILKGIRYKYEEYHHVTITEEALVSAVKMSVRYINDRFLPDKAIDIIDEAASKLRLLGSSKPLPAKKLELEIKKADLELEAAITAEDFVLAGKIKREQEKKQKRLEKERAREEAEPEKFRLSVGENEVADIVAGWTKIPVKRLAEEETERLKKLEAILHRRVIGQEEAVSAVSKAIKRGRVGLKDPNKPIGSFLFLGPTGVGKTELSKALAQAMFGTEDAIIRVDMSEYMEKHSVSKMIGSPPGYVGYDEGGQLSEKVRRNPYSVILFDEIEKAHPDVFNILLQVLDDGHITDAQGRKINFKNTVIIMTSNAGAQSIVSPKKLGFASIEDEKENYTSMKNNVMAEVKRIFKPEFLNRIDEVIVFHSLTREHMKKIVSLLLKNLQERCKNQMNMELVVRDSVKQFIVETGTDEKYGARPLKRAIQNRIEDALAEEILNGRIRAGEPVIVGLSNKKIKFFRKEA